MAIYGFGSTFDSTDVSDEFFRQEMACVGWSEADAPPLHDILRSIRTGDIVYIKSFAPHIGLIIKAVGIVTDRNIRQYRVLGHQRSGVPVNWLWQGPEDRYGKIEDKYPVRSFTLFEEHTLEVQQRVIGHLLAGAATQD